MLGTIMAANVFFVIIPMHWKLVRAKEAGEEPDPAWNARGKQRSVHNNYFTLPVVFAMLSNHFTIAYGHTHAWLILVVLMALGALVRHYFNLRHSGRDAWWILAVAAVGFVALAIAIRPASSGVERRRPRPQLRRGAGDRREPLRPLPLAAPDPAGLLRAARRDRARDGRPDPGGSEPDPDGRRRLEGDAARQRDRT